MGTRVAEPAKSPGSRKGRKVGKPRGKTCQWTAELDDVLKAAWARGGLRAAGRAIRQYRPTWSRYSVKKRAAALDLCRPRAPRWTDADENHLLWSIDSNASLNLIAQRLGRSVAAVRKKLRDLEYTAESLGGFKVKDVAEMFAVPPARVQYWVAEKLEQSLAEPQSGPTAPPDAFARVIKVLMNPAGAQNEGTDRSDALSRGLIKPKP